VPGHRGIEVNEIKDQLAKKGSEHPFIGPEPACSISERAAKWAIRDCMNRKHQEYWQFTPGQKHAKGCLQEPSGKKTRELLRLNRNQLGQVTGLLTGHCCLKGHVCKLGFLNSPTCERDHNKEEMLSHVLCDCEALVELRSCHLGSHFMKPNDYKKALLSKVLHLIQSARQLEG
jgi:hypothetical protein